MAQSILPKAAVVLYLRMSSAKQDKSIPAQRDELLALAKRQGYTVVREYQDAAISGDDTEKRTGFLKLRDDAETLRDFSIILVWDQDRLSRNDPLEVGYWLKPIRDAGVVVETPQGKVDWETLGGRLIYLISQEMKHDYLRSLSRNVSRGMLAAARRETRQGTGGLSPTGYRTEKDQVVVDAELAAVIRRIFEEYLKPGAGLRAVADALNRDGIMSPKGLKWGATSIRAILKNRKYTGAFIRFKHKCGKYHGVKDGEIVNRTRADECRTTDADIVIEGNHEPIINQETFDQVQRKLAQQGKRTAHRTGRQYPLSGLVRCGDCGRSMQGYASASNCGRKQVYHGYVCRTYREKGRTACHANSIGEAPLLDCVRRMIRQHYLSDGAIERMREQIKRQQQAEDQTHVLPTDQRQARKRIGVLDQQIDQGAERVFTAPEAIVPKLYAKLEQLRSEREQLQRQLDAAGRQDAHSAADQGQAAEAALDALRTLRITFDAADPEDIRELIKTLVVKIELHYSHKHDGKRAKNTIEGGTIFVRPDKRLSLLYTDSDTHPRSAGRMLPRSR